MRWFTILVLAVAVGLASAASPYASSSPDGLEKVAAEQAFRERGERQASPAPDYAFPGVDDSRVATGLSGFVGTLVVFSLGYGLAAVTRGRRPQAA